MTSSQKHNTSQSSPCMPRRTLIVATTATLVNTVFPSNVFADEAVDRPKEGDYFVDFEDTKFTPLRADQIIIGQPQIIAWPVSPNSKIVRDGSRLNKVLLLRIDPATMTEQTRSRSAEGIIAYSAICQHGGCEVTNWIDGPNILECPCHNSQYNPRDAALVIDGPTPKPLPALPIKIIDGVIVAAGTFTGRVGFQQL